MRLGRAAEDEPELESNEHDAVAAEDEFVAEDEAAGNEEGAGVWSKDAFAEGVSESDVVATAEGVDGKGFVENLIVDCGMERRVQVVAAVVTGHASTRSP